MALLPSDGFHSSLMFRRSLSFPYTRTRPSTTLKFLRTTSALSTSTKSQTTPLCSESAPSSSFYEVLGVPMGASSHQIKAAYRKLARLSHPDVASYDKNETLAQVFIKIHTAYSHYQTRLRGQIMTTNSNGLWSLRWQLGIQDLPAILDGCGRLISAGD